MAATIKFNQYNTFIRGVKDALYEIYLCLLGDPFNAEKTDFIYSGNYTELFKDEFYEVLINNLDHEKSIKAYIEEVYYNGIGNLLIFAKDLQKRRLTQLGGDFGQAVNDELFLKISNGYKETLQSLASKVFTENKKHHLINLKFWGDLERADYNISGQFTGLFKSENDSKPKPTIEYSEPDYLLPLATLQKIHKAFNGEIWEDIKLNDFYSLFNLHNNEEVVFRVKEKDNFYALLWSIFSVAEPPVTQEEYIKPLLNKYNCSFNSFGNVKKNRIESNNPQHKKLMRRIEETLR